MKAVPPEGDRRNSAAVSQVESAQLPVGTGQGRAPEEGRKALRVPAAKGGREVLCPLSQQEAGQTAWGRSGVRVAAGLWAGRPGCCHQRPLLWLSPCDSKRGSESSPRCPALVVALFHCHR